MSIGAWGYGCRGAGEYGSWGVRERGSMGVREIRCMGNGVKASMACSGVVFVECEVFPSLLVLVRKITNVETFRWNV